MGRGKFGGGTGTWGSQWEPEASVSIALAVSLVEFCRLAGEALEFR